MDGRLLTALAVLGIGTAAAVSGSRGVVRASRAAPPDRTPYPKANPGTRLRKLEDEALPCGWVIRTHAPGDGVTRYGFFSLDDMERQAARSGEPFNPNLQSYWGPASAAKTVLGIGKAETYFRENLKHQVPGSKGVVRRGRGVVQGSSRKFLLVVSLASEVVRRSVSNALDEEIDENPFVVERLLLDENPGVLDLHRIVTLDASSSEFGFRRRIQDWAASRRGVRDWNVTAIEGSRGVVRRSREAAVLNRSYRFEIFLAPPGVERRSDIEQSLDDGILLLRLETNLVADVSDVSPKDLMDRISRKVTLRDTAGGYDEFRRWILDWSAGQSGIRDWYLRIRSKGEDGEDENANRGSRGTVRRGRRGAPERTQEEAIRELQGLTLFYGDTVAGKKPILHGKTINGWLWSGYRKIAAVPSSSFAHFFFNGLPESWVHLESRPPEPTPMRVVKILRVSVADPRPGGSLGVTEATTVHFSSGMTMVFFDHQEASVLGLARQAFSLLATALDVPFEETA